MRRRRSSASSSPGAAYDLVITSKVFFPTGGDVNAGGLSRRHITRAVEDSLTRLGTDRLDFYFVHNFDKLTPIEETVRTLDDLQAQGKILYPAVSQLGGSADRDGPRRRRARVPRPVRN